MKPANYLLFFLFIPFVICAQEQQYSDTLYMRADKLGDNYRGLFIKFGKQPAEKMYWRLSSDDSLGFAEVGYNDAVWEKYSNKILYDTPVKEKVGDKVCWFRGKIHVDTSAANLPVAFVFKGSGAAAFFWDGKLVSKIDNIGKKDPYNYSDFLNYPVFVSLGDTGVHVLAVRYENKEAIEFDDDGWGIELMVKKPFNIYKERENTLIISSVVLVGLGTLFFALFIVHTLFFLFYRKSTSNFYFALFNLGMAMALFSLYYTVISDSQFNDEYVATTIMSTSLIASCFALGAFTTTLFGKGRTFLYIILVIGIAAIVTTLIDIYIFTDFSAYIVITLIVLSAGYTIIQIILAMFRKVPGARLLGIGILYFFAVLIILVIMSVAGGGLNINNWVGLFVISAFLSIPVSISAFLAWQFSHVSKSLSGQLFKVETLSKEKQQILETQNERLEQQVAERTRELQLEKKKSDDLLLNILPQEVAEELKEKGASKAQYYDEVSVLFTDFVSFTSISEKLGAERLLEELNANFTVFDRIMEKHGLEKIKTIGDAYLAVSGLPNKNPEHAQNAVRAAIEIIEFVRKRQKEVPYGLNIRVGIHSGSLVAGIVGVKKFAYDIWGDTVNIAARMEQNSEPGKINVSDTTCHLINDEFECVHRGKINAKGKGEMDMYFVKEQTGTHAGI